MRLWFREQPSAAGQPGVTRLPRFQLGASARGLDHGDCVQIQKPCLFNSVRTTSEAYAIAAKLIRPSSFTTSSMRCQPTPCLIDNPPNRPATGSMTSAIAGHASSATTRNTSFAAARQAVDVMSGSVDRGCFAAVATRAPCRCPIRVGMIYRPRREAALPPTASRGGLIPRRANKLVTIGHGSPLALRFDRCYKPDGLHWLVALRLTLQARVRMLGSSANAVMSQRVKSP